MMAQSHSDERFQLTGLVCAGTIVSRGDRSKMLGDLPCPVAPAIEYVILSEASDPEDYSLEAVEAQGFFTHRGT